MLRDAYNSYIANVSPASMALSWEALEAITQVLYERMPKSIIEYGSGISTYVLALYGQEKNIKIASFDSDAEWSQKTSAFLEQLGLHEWATVEFADSVLSRDPVDFIIWDFDKNPKRVDLMGAAFKNLAVGGVIYVDDMQSREIALALENLQAEVIRTVDKDGFGRYGVFAEKR